MPKTKNDGKVSVFYKDGFIYIKAPYNESANYPDSSTGKSEIVASSRGYLPVKGADGVGVNFNITRKK